MDGKIMLDLDKLPIKRLESIEESGLERFPPERGPDEARLDLIRRIDFSTVVERDAKKAKSSKEAAAAPWPWLGLVENLRLAHQELSVIIDLINTVEANDAVTVAGMTRPKLLPNEVLSDLSVSAATKLQHFRHLGRYFKQSSKALEKQVTKEARFYGALIRLQQNWKVKRHRLPTSAPGSESFTFDLLDNMLADSVPFSRSSSMSTVRVDNDSSGMLTVQLPPKSCRLLTLGFLSSDLGGTPISSTKKKIRRSGKLLEKDCSKEALSEEDVNECVRVSHSSLRDIHHAIFEEQVFAFVNRETFSTSSGVHIIGMREDFLQLGINEEVSIFMCLMPSEQDSLGQAVDSTPQSRDGGNLVPDNSSSDSMVVDRKHITSGNSNLKFPDPVCFQIYLKHILHENIITRAKARAITKHQSGQSGDGSSLLGHFCLTISHRIFSTKVLSELEKLASGTPYLHLLTNPTWHSRISSWSLSMKVPKMISRVGPRQKLLDAEESKAILRVQFRLMVVVTDERINVSGGCAPNVVGSFGGNAKDIRPANNYGCDLVDLPVLLLQQVASQVIHWLHEEAVVVGANATRDFLCLYLDLDEGSKIGLVAHVDSEDACGCISWWLVMDDGSTEGGKPHTRSPAAMESESKKFLGHLSLEALYSILMDLINLCSCTTP